MARVTLRHATLADIPTLTRWDQEPHVISATTDDPDATDAFEGIVWEDEIASGSDVSRYWIAELEGRPIGAMQIIDPHLEPTHYWGEIAPNLRALDIWIGEASDLGKGYGEQMMRLAIDMCFADLAVSGILIDPLASNTRAHRFYQRLGFKSVERRVFNDEDVCLVHSLSRQHWMEREALIEVRCVSDAKWFLLPGDVSDGREADLTVGAVYLARAEGDVFRVWDNSGEDYLYPKDRFEVAANCKESP